LTDVDIADCKLRDVSRAGARIWVEDPEIIPDYFKLRISGARQIVKCRVRWRSGGEMGIEFFGAK
jgi:PilZ domain-containing protein